MKNYGKEVIVDLHSCDVTKFNRKSIESFFIELCDLIDMERCDLHFWDYEDHPEEYKNAPDHLKGTSAIQFIKTSNITIHTLTELHKVFLNVFSCKYFDEYKVLHFSLNWFSGIAKNWHTIERI